MRVAEVMTTEVLTVGPGPRSRTCAEILSDRGISGAARWSTTDGGDPRRRQRGGHHPQGEPARHSRRGWRRIFDRGGAPLGEGARTHRGRGDDVAGDDGDGRRGAVDAAAALMLDRQVNRLPVLDDAGKLAGIVTRADLVRAFVHSDEEIAPRDPRGGAAARALAAPGGLRDRRWRAAR